LGHKLLGQFVAILHPQHLTIPSARAPWLLLEQYSWPCLQTPASSKVESLTLVNSTRPEMNGCVLAAITHLSQNVVRISDATSYVTWFFQPLLSCGQLPLLLDTRTRRDHVIRKLSSTLLCQQSTQNNLESSA